MKPVYWLGLSDEQVAALHLITNAHLRQVMAVHEHLSKAMAGEVPKTELPAVPAKSTKRKAK